MYCKIGEKPKIIYNFNNKLSKTFESQVSPIEIVTTNLSREFTGGQCECVRYRTVFQYFDKSGNSQLAGDYDAFNFFGPIQGIRTIILSDGAIGIQILSRGYAEHTCLDHLIWTTRETSQYDRSQINNIRFYQIRRLDNQPDNCGDPNDKCQIDIKHNGQIIFSDKGGCPINFNVQCGDCPEGTIRCEQPGYPGYCCLPCQPIAQRINNLAARIK